MRKLVWGILCIVCFVVTYSCKKDSGCGYSDQNIIAPWSEKQAVKAYLDSMGIHGYSIDSSGLHYEILGAGEGNHPGLCSQIGVSYTGKLTNGSVFEQKTAALTLGGTIEGFRKGISLIGKGGHIRLYIPPTLAYGSRDMKDQSGAVVIPANSILVFDLVLNTVN